MQRGKSITIEWELNRKVLMKKRLGKNILKRWELKRMRSRTKEDRPRMRNISLIRNEWWGILKTITTPCWWLPTKSTTGCHLMTNNIWCLSKTLEKLLWTSTSSSLRPEITPAQAWASTISSKRSCKTWRIIVKIKISTIGTRETNMAILSRWAGSPCKLKGTLCHQELRLQCSLTHSESLSLKIPNSCREIHTSATKASELWATIAAKFVLKLPSNSSLPSQWQIKLQITLSNSTLKEWPSNPLNESTPTKIKVQSKEFTALTATTCRCLVCPLLSAVIKEEKEWTFWQLNQQTIWSAAITESSPPTERISKLSPTRVRASSILAADLLWDLHWDNTDIYL